MGDNISSHAKAFREKYLVQFDDDIKQLEALGADGGEESSVRERVIKLHYFAHKIAGSAATFGLESSSRSARVLEDLADAMPEAADEFPSDVRAEISNLIGALRQQHSEAVSGDALKKDAENQNRNSRTPHEATERLLAVCGGPVFSQNISEDFLRFGYRVQRVDTADGLAVFADGSPPTAILIWLEVLSGVGLEEAMAKMLSEAELSTIPVLFVSDKDGFELRAKAVKVGGDGFLLTPLDAATCDREIREIESRNGSYAPRILIVSGEQRLHSQLSLESTEANLHVSILESPEDVLQAIADLKPDALLIESGLATCSAFELARLVSQADAVESIPILFVGNTDQDVQTFRRLGLDKGDFVTAPCGPGIVARAVMLCIAEQGSPEAKHAQQLRLCSLLDRKTLYAIANKPDGPIATVTEPIESGTPDSGQAKRPLVLIVDDDRLLTEAIKSALAENGFDVLCAHDGEEAFHMAFAEEPDLILSDYNMPGGSGGHLCRRLNDSVVTRDIPTIIMTRESAYGGKNYALEREMLGRAGVSAFLTKPIDFDELITQINRYIVANTAAVPVFAS